MAAGLSLAVFLLLGGGGAPSPLVLGGLEVLGLICLGGLLYFHAFVRPIRIGVWPGGVLLVAGCALVAAQLVPLPWELWSTLPGHALPARALAAAGLDGTARPLSLAPAYTRSALLTLLPALATFLFCAALNFERRLRMLRVLLIVALASAALGLLQVLMPNTPQLYLSSRAIFELSSGIFANRNSQANFLLVAIITCIALAKVAENRREQRGYWGWTAAIVGFLSAMTFATQSRFGLAGLIVLLAVGTYALGAFSRSETPRFPKDAPRSRWRWIDSRVVVTAIAVLFAGAGIYLAGGGALERLSIGPTEDAVGELRITAIPDLVVAIKTYFPFGAGLGTFDAVYRSVESLELVSPQYFNHAHNDFIELFIEAGTAGMLLPIAFVVALAIATVTRRRDKSRTRRTVHLAAAAGLALMLLHSFVDYPLRTVTVGCSFALLAAILFVPDDWARGTPPIRSTRAGALRVAAAVAIAVAVI
ncbi:MAG: O-antigen ligase family protein, partial [Tsuneonella sp.]